MLDEAHLNSTEYRAILPPYRTLRGELQGVETIDIVNGRLFSSKNIMDLKEEGIIVISISNR